MLNVPKKLPSSRRSPGDRVDILLYPASQLLSEEAKSGGGGAAEGCSSGPQAASHAAGTAPAGPANAAACFRVWYIS